VREAGGDEELERKAVAAQENWRGE